MSSDIQEVSNLKEILCRKKVAEIRKKYYKAEKNPNCINLTVLKNRHGKKGTIALNWDGDYSRISNFMR